MILTMEDTEHTEIKNLHAYEKSPDYVYLL